MAIGYLGLSLSHVGARKISQPLRFPVHLPCPFARSWDIRDGANVAGGEPPISYKQVSAELIA